MHKKCKYCSRFCSHDKEEMMCKECKKEYEIAFAKIRNNKDIQDVCKRLNDR